MTKAEIERAIEYFDETLKKQRNTIVERGFYGDEVPEEDGRALTVAFTALTCLREALKRAEGCEWCTAKPKQKNYHDVDIESYLCIDDDGEFCIKTSLSTYDEDCYIISDIRCCPYCGRRMGEEARDD